MSLRRGALALTLLGAVTVAGCDRPATQVVVLIDSDMAPATELRLVRVRLRRAGAPTWRYDRTFEVAPRAQRLEGTHDTSAGVQLPGAVSVDADDPDDPRPLDVEVAAFLRDDDGNFSQRVTVPFARESVLYLTMYLAGRCRLAENRVCPSGSVCGSTGCTRVDDLVSPRAPAVDAGAATDTAPPQCAPAGAERCYDGLDNNCDGRVDEGCARQSCANTTRTSLGVQWPSGVDPARFDSHCSTDEMLPATPLGLGETADGGAAVTGVSVAPFRIDRYEVTVARFTAFFAASMPRPPHDRVTYPDGDLTAAALLGDGRPWPVTGPLAYSPANRYCHFNPTGTLDREAHPVNCIDWFTAQAFCVWDGGRLPTEAEWEYAARYLPLPDASPSQGITSPRRYPWGGDDFYTCAFNYDEPDCARARVAAETPYGTWAVSRTARIEPFYRVFDLAGNVAEWTADVFADYDSACWSAAGRRDNPRCALPSGALRFTARGGGYHAVRFDVRGAAREGVAASARLRTLGFRCVYAR